MKKFILVCLVFSSLYLLLMSFDSLSEGSNINHSIDSTDYYKAKCDTLTFLASQYEKFLIDYENEHTVLKDSISRLNKRPVMTEAAEVLQNMQEKTKPVEILQGLEHSSF